MEGLGSCVASLYTRNSLTFVNTTAIAYTQKVGRSLNILVYAIAVVFTNVRELRVQRARRKMAIAATGMSSLVFWGKVWARVSDTVLRITCLPSFSF